MTAVSVVLPATYASARPTAMRDATELNSYILQAVRQWVRAGFYRPEEVAVMLDDLLEPGADEALLRAAIPLEFARQATEEAAWPAVTDCDRLDVLFRQLNAHGILALQNAGYTTSDGHGDVAQALAEHRPPGRWRGYCFYHGQDTERAIVGGGLWLAFGALGPGAGPHDDAAIGQEVKAAFEQQGFTVEWDGSASRKLSIPAFRWCRRQSGSEPGLRGWRRQVLP